MLKLKQRVEHQRDKKSIKTISFHQQGSKAPPGLTPRPKITLAANSMVTHFSPESSFFNRINLEQHLNHWQQKR